MRIDSSLWSGPYTAPDGVKIVKSMAVMAVTYVALEAVKNLGAEAGPASYATCIATCVPASLAGGPAVATCVALCLPALAPWLP